MTPATHEFADDAIARYVQGATLGPLEVRAMRDSVAARSQARPGGPAMAQVLDVTAGDRPARVYRPDTAEDAPLLLWLHGGGWTIGTLDSTDRVARLVAAASGVTVVALDYRLSPEHPWPAAVYDTAEALVWLRSESATDTLGFRRTAVGVAGDSAGGTLAALATLRLVVELPALRPDLLALCYANTDLAGHYPSRDTKGDGFGLDTTATRFFNGQWVERAFWDSPGVSPLHHPLLEGLPPTLVVTAEHDHLRDEGAAFGDRLQELGVHVDYRCEPGLVRNFLMLDTLSEAAAAAADHFARDVGRLLGSAERRR